MAKKKAKLLLIGLDGAMPGLIRKFSDEGEIPNMSRLISDGSFLEVLPSVPCDTPTNWTTIVTGAWTGTHGATGFNCHLPGESLSAGAPCSFDRTLNMAEHLWDVGERCGLRSLIYDYPPSWPPTVKDGFVVGGWYSSVRGPSVGEFKKPNFERVGPYPEYLKERLGRLKLPPLAARPFPKELEETRIGKVARETERTAGMLVKTAATLIEEPGWDMLFCHIHILDNIAHTLLNDAWENHPDYAHEKGERAWEMLRTAYKLLDETIAALVEKCADETTTVCVCSDHGAVPSTSIVWPGSALAGAGLVKFVKDEDASDYRIDLAHSKAAFYFSPPEYIWVNLKGREPDGIVEPGAEYEHVRDKIIEALYSVKEPTTGKCPFSVVLRKEQASFLGQWGPRCGDIVCCVEPEFALIDFGMDNLVEGGIAGLLEMGDTRYGGDSRHGNHHGHLPTHKIDPFSVSGILIVNGPGVRKGYQRTLPMQMVDVAPTLAHLVGLPMPAQCEGSLLWQVLI